MVDHIRARKTSSYSQNIWHKERWWAQIFAPHNDGTLPEHLCFLIQNEAWGSIFPFPQQDKIPHYSVPMRKEHTQKNLTDRSLFLILHLSLSPACSYRCSYVLKSSSPPADQLGLPKPPFFPATHPLTAVFDTSHPFQSLISFTLF